MGPVLGAKCASWIKEKHRPQIGTLACPYTDCHLYSKRGAGNLTVRKLYGKDRIRYLRCHACAREFSERKGTALFNTKVAEQKAISVAEHLAEGASTKATSRLVGVSAEAVRRLRRNLGDHAKNFHDERVRELECTSVQMDERYGYAKSKKEPLWEATAIDPESRLLRSALLPEVGTRRSSKSLWSRPKRGSRSLRISS